jgi:hypothetical protein
LNSLQSDRQADRREYVCAESAQVKGIIVDGKVDELARFACAGKHGPLSLLDVGQGRRLLEVWHQDRSPQSRSGITENGGIRDERR